jgi:hypothetical protein
MCSGNYITTLSHRIQIIPEPATLHIEISLSLAGSKLVRKQRTLPEEDPARPKHIAIEAECTSAVNNTTILFRI